MVIEYAGGELFNYIVDNTRVKNLKKKSSLGRTLMRFER